MILLNVADQWMKYLGHFHPVVVHLPIGILFVALILELVAWKQNQASLLKRSVEICLAAGFFSAVISCLFGWFLSHEGGYEETTLKWHQWMGIGVAVLSGIGWLIRSGTLLRFRSAKPYRVLLAAIFIGLLLTGHLGGNMTHGEDYLTAGLPQPFAGWLGIETKEDTVAVRKPIADLNEAILYTDLVQPIFSEKCYACHSSRKVKGALRMDQEDLLFKGGKHGVVIVPGDEAGSELMKRLQLPVEDDKRMPPKDQPQLSKEEIALIGWWIKTGADPRKKIKDFSPDSSMLPILASFITGATDSASPSPLSKVFEEEPSPANAETLAKLTGLGVLVSPVAKGRNLLQVSCVNYSSFSNADAALLSSLSENIVWLRLDNTAITDEALSYIGKLKNLVRLNLSGTAVSSAGLKALLSLKNLEYINMVNTRVDDQGLQILSSISSLKKIYCWNSLITPGGISVFRDQRPSVDVDSGDEMK